MKKILSILTALSIFLSFGVSSSAKGCSWYIKRNGTSQPPCPESEEFMEKYGVYYMDTKLSDDSADKKLYLTFDLGYVNENVIQILDTLKEESVPAAFFILDNVIYKNADVLNRMTEEGHLICNHTKRHKDLSDSSAEEIKTDLMALESIYREKTGKELSKYFRFPEGKYSESALQCISSMGYKTIFWSFAYADWDNARQPSESAAIKKIMDNTHNGAVILLHPTSSTNAKILNKVICKWKDMGYTFGTLDELTNS